MQPASRTFARNTGLACALLLLAGCGLLAGSSKQDWLIVDGCAIYATGVRAEAGDVPVSTLKIDEGCRLEFQEISDEETLPELPEDQ